MSCCQRAGAARPSDARWAVQVSPPVATPRPPERLRFAGPSALSLPVGTRRVLAVPGEEVLGLNDAERLVLWRTGLFEPVG